MYAWKQGNLKLVLKQQMAELHFSARAADAVTLGDCISYFRYISSSSYCLLWEMVTSQECWLCHHKWNEWKHWHHYTGVHNHKALSQLRINSKNNRITKVKSSLKRSLHLPAKPAFLYFKRLCCDVDEGPLKLSGWWLVYLIIFSNQNSALYFETEVCH